ncbi:putative periplasmic serine endoprotease DegP-like precursor [Anaerohalosphaera lusitana]|uniref:Putative periplasmic serine endoprotease DegP-like n=1 Tax=Anaerohalosphaera lusitana TaxID=1936003 RepID=A0A1U9NJ13_9BACT|nr:trypsin-like peptidase domain-containing protein [Anaerohalosphaera lusitana]AQT67714.1 putative periplasmic serine endoprotease DegP-like precursor [Anaerohalosphaera lusitana]
MVKRILLVLVSGVILAGLSGCNKPATVNKVIEDEPERLLDFRKIVQQAKDEVFPTVVYIKCIREDHTQGKKMSQEVGGSGVIISVDGEVLTNWHVVDKALEVRCLLYDGRAMDAEVLGTDKDADLALLKLDKGEDEQVPFANVGDSSKLREGDFVMAMGAPLGLSRSVSIGIISCTDRYLPDDSQYSVWLQTDASISPGNSGGPLVNTDGEVVGINTLGVIFGGDMGFSIPSNTVKMLVPQLREHGEVKWSWLGLQLQALRDFEKDIYFDGDQGVIVAETDPESPARRAGLQPRDRIMSIAGRDVRCLTQEDLPAIRRTIGMLEKGEIVTLQYSRGGEIRTVELKPTDKGAVEGEELDCPRWDMTVKEINRFDKPDLYFYRNEGVFIYGVKYPGNARDAGLRENDIILKIDGEKVKTLDDVSRIRKELVDKVDEKSKVVVSVLRKGLLRQCVLDYSRDYEKE